MGSSFAGQADAVKRVDRVQLALYEMGSTVFGGAMTSLGASAMLFGCWIQYVVVFLACMS